MAPRKSEGFVPDEVSASPEEFSNRAEQVLSLLGGQTWADSVEADQVARVRKAGEEITAKLREEEDLAVTEEEMDDEDEDEEQVEANMEPVGEDVGDIFEEATEVFERVSHIGGFVEEEEGVEGKGKQPEGGRVLQISSDGKSAYWSPPSKKRPSVSTTATLGLGQTIVDGPHISPPSPMARSAVSVHPESGSFGGTPITPTVPQTGESSKRSGILANTAEWRDNLLSAIGVQPQSHVRFEASTEVSERSSPDKEKASVQVATNVRAPPVTDAQLKNTIVAKKLYETVGAVESLYTSVTAMKAQILNMEKSSANLVAENNKLRARVNELQGRIDAFDKVSLGVLNRAEEIVKGAAATAEDTREISEKKKEVEAAVAQARSVEPLTLLPIKNTAKPQRRVRLF